MKRLVMSVVISLILWLAATALLCSLWLPPSCEGCADDPGAGVLAVMIAAATLFVTAIGVAIFNIAAWILEPPPTAQ